MRLCDFPGCEKYHYAKGYCVAHWRQLKRARPLTSLWTPNRNCDFPGCTEPHRRNGLCNSHSTQQRMGIPLREIEPKVIDLSKRGEKNRRDCRRRANLLRNAPGFHSEAQVKDRIAYFGDRCAYCSGPYEHIDHAIPLSKGGSLWPSNLVPSCS